MLIDKGYYDYDFERNNAQSLLLYENTVKSDEETRDLLSRFGFGKPKEESLEQIQELAMKELNENKE